LYLFSINYTLFNNPNAYNGVGREDISTPLVGFFARIL
jgi:hypothetical protein